MRALNVPATLATLAIVVAWEATCRTVLAGYELLPPPSLVALAIASATMSGELPLHVLQTLRAVLIGWVIAVFLGVAIGAALAFSPAVARWSAASVEVLRPLPAVAFLPVAVLIFGFSTTTEVAVIVYGSIWPVLVNTADGLRSVHQRMHDVASTFRLSRSQRLIAVEIPAALPSMLTGLRLSLGLALVVAIVAEMIGHPAGLGWEMVRAQESMNPQLMFGYLLSIGLLGVILNHTLVASARSLFPGMREIQRADGPA